MAAGTKTSFVIYHDQVHTSFVETLQQVTDAFNEASQGAIIMRPMQSRGDYRQESFFDLIPNLIARRDPTSVAAVSDKPITQDEHVLVKLNRRVGPVAQTHDAWRKIAEDPGAMSVVVGAQIAKAVAVEQLNTALRAAVTAVGNVTALNHDGTTGSPTTLTTGKLISALSKAGDSQDGIALWVMHSSSWFALMQDQVANTVIDTVAGAVINGGSPRTLGRPVLVTDSSVLFNAATSPDSDHVILGLRRGAVRVEETELGETVNDTITGLENLVERIQGEYAYNVGVTGWKWNVSGGGANPTDAALATSGNWITTYTDNRLRAGLMLSTR